MVFDLSEQKIWNDFRQKNSQKGINKMILNRCLLDEQHKCALLTLNFCDYKDVKNIKKKLTLFRLITISIGINLLFLESIAEHSTHIERGLGNID